MKRIPTLTLVFVLFLTMTSNVFAQSLNYEPKEEVRNGTRYLDGLPYYSEEDIKRKDFRNESILLERASENNFESASTVYNKWFLIGTKNYYTSQDMDSAENNTNSNIKRTITTESYTTVELTGEVKYGFKSVAEAAMSLKVGKRWGKTVSDEYTIKPKTIFTQKTACEVKQRSYKYIKTSLLGNTNYYAQSHDKVKVKTWYWEKEI